MLGRQHQVGSARQGIRPGREDRDHGWLGRRSTGHREADHRAVAAADPVPLHRLDRLRPVQRLQVGQQPVRVRGDPQHPLPQRPPVDRVVPDVAAPVGGDLLVGQHRAQVRGPVDHLIGDVGQPPAIRQLAARHLVQLRPRLPVRVGRAGRLSRPGLELGDQLRDGPGPVLILVEPAVEDLQEDPLGPAVEAGIGGRYLPAGIMPEAQPAQLPAHDLDVDLGGDGRMLPGFDRVLLGGQAERVVAVGVQDRIPGHPQVPRVRVGADITDRMADMQAGAAGVGEHVEHVELRPAAACPKPSDSGPTGFGA